MSHDSAALLWGLELAHEPSQFITVARNRSRAAFPVLDCATVLDLRHAVVVADSALRAGLVTLDELKSAAGNARGQHARKLRRVAKLADPRSGSVLESLIRVLLFEAGLAPDRSQCFVTDKWGSVVARVDFAYLTARLIVEADGFEFHRERADYRKDRRRANAFCLLGWRLLRFTWEDVVADPDYVIATVRAALAQRVPSNTRKAA